MSIKKKKEKEHEKWSRASVWNWQDAKNRLNDKGTYVISGIDNCGFVKLTSGWH